MRYIKEFEHFREYTPSEILNRILNIITNTKPKSIIYEEKIFDNFYWNFYWVLYEYKAKSKMDKYSKLPIYEENAELIKQNLEMLPEVEKVEIKYQGRFAPFEPDSTSGGGQKSNETIYEVRCYIKKEYLDEIKLNYEIKKSASEYNL